MHTVNEPDSTTYQVRFHGKTVPFSNIDTAIASFDYYLNQNKAPAFFEHTVSNGWSWENQIEDPHWWYRGA